MQKNIESKVVNQLNRVIGQLQAIVRVINDTDCESVLMQLKAIEKSIKSVSIAVLKNHFSNCVIEGLRENEGEARDEFSKLLDRYL